MLCDITLFISTRALKICIVSVKIELRFQKHCLVVTLTLGSGHAITNVLAHRVTHASRASRFESRLESDRFRKWQARSRNAVSTAHVTECKIVR